MYCVLIIFVILNFSLNNAMQLKENNDTNLWPKNTEDIRNPDGIIGNGQILAIIDKRGTLYDIFAPHLGVTSKNSMYGRSTPLESTFSYAKFNIWSNFFGYSETNENNPDIDWLNTDEWNHKQEYVKDTAILETNANKNGISIKINDFAPKSDEINFPINSDNKRLTNFIIRKIQVKNEREITIKNVSLFYFEDWSINGGKDKDQLVISNNSILRYDVETNGASLFFETLSFQKHSVIKKQNDSLTIITWPIGELKPNETKDVTLFVIGAYGPYKDDFQAYYYWEVPIKTWLVNQSVDVLEELTKKHWKNFLLTLTSLTTPDKDMDAIAKRALILTNLLFDEERGVYLAGLIGGAYRGIWLRDEAFVFDTMSKYGQNNFVELLKWVNKSEKIINRQGNTYFLQRYYADGMKSDWINVQVDSGALIPWSTWKYYERTGNNLIFSYYEQIKSLAFGASENDDQDTYWSRQIDFMENESLMFSQELWEDKFGAFFYTNAAVYAGLEALENLANEKGEKKDADIGQQRKTLIKQGLEQMWEEKEGRYLHAINHKRSFRYSNNITRSKVLDISMLGAVTPLNVFAPNEDKIIKTFEAIKYYLNNPDLSVVEDPKNKFKMVNNEMDYFGPYSAIRYRTDPWIYNEESTDYSQDRFTNIWGDIQKPDNSPDFADVYYDGGPWTLSSVWIAQYLFDRNNGNDIDEAHNYLKFIADHTDHLGLMAEQIAKPKDNTTFSLIEKPGIKPFIFEAAWPNTWESETFFADAYLKFADPDYNALTNTLMLKPKLPSNWTWINASITINDLNGYNNLNERMYVSGKIEFSEEIEGNERIWNLNNRLPIDINLIGQERTGGIINLIEGIGFFGFEVQLNIDKIIDFETELEKDKVKIIRIIRII